MKEKSSFSQLSRRKLLLFGGFSFAFNSIVVASRIRPTFASKTNVEGLASGHAKGNTFRENDFESKSVFLDAEGQVVEEREIKVQGYIETFEELGE